jgi:hypothetical protein
VYELQPRPGNALVRKESDADLKLFVVAGPIDPSARHGLYLAVIDQRPLRATQRIECGLEDVVDVGGNVRFVAAPLVQEPLDVNLYVTRDQEVQFACLISNQFAHGLFSDGRRLQ